LGPFSGQSVTFEGTQDGGGSLIYKDKLTFDSPVTVTGVSLSGSAFNNYGGVTAQLELLDSSGSVISDFPTGAPTLTYQSYNFTPSACPAGTVFYLEEFDGSTLWRYRDSIGVTFSAVPEPSTFALLGAAALGLAGYALRRKLRAV